MIQSGATTSGQSGHGSDANEGMLRIPQSSSITGTSSSDCLVSYPGHLLGGYTLCKKAVRIFYSPSRLGKPEACVSYLSKSFGKEQHLSFVYDI